MSAVRPAAVEARGVGEWRAVEMDMANWAQKRGMLRRTDHACRRRYINLEPEKHEKHIRVSSVFFSLSSGVDNKQHAAFTGSQITAFRIISLFSAALRLKSLHGSGGYCYYIKTRTAVDSVATCAV